MASNFEAGRLPSASGNGEGDLGLNSGVDLVIPGTEHPSKRPIVPLNPLPPRSEIVANLSSQLGAVQAQAERTSVARTPRLESPRVPVLLDDEWDSIGRGLGITRVTSTHYTTEGAEEHVGMYPSPNAHNPEARPYIEDFLENENSDRYVLTTLDDGHDPSDLMPMINPETGEVTHTLVSAEGRVIYSSSPNAPIDLPKPERVSHLRPVDFQDDEREDDPVSIVEKRAEFDELKMWKRNIAEMTNLMQGQDEIVMAGVHLPQLHDEGFYTQLQQMLKRGAIRSFEVVMVDPYLPDEEEYKRLSEMMPSVKDLPGLLRNTFDRLLRLHADVQESTGFGFDITLLNRALPQDFIAVGGQEPDSKPLQMRVQNEPLLRTLSPDDSEYGERSIQSPVQELSSGKPEEYDRIEDILVNYYNSYDRGEAMIVEIPDTQAETQSMQSSY